MSTVEYSRADGYWYAHLDDSTPKPWPEERKWDGNFAARDALRAVGLDFGRQVGADSWEIRVRNEAEEREKEARWREKRELERDNERLKREESLARETAMGWKVLAIFLALGLLGAMGGVAGILGFD
jgi:hypothetical protein